MLGCAEVTIAPSATEAGLSRTFFDSVSRGTPVLMARYPRAFDDVASISLLSEFLVDPSDAAAMAVTIENTIQNRGEMRNKAI